MSLLSFHYSKAPVPLLLGNIEFAMYDYSLLSSPPNTHSLFFFLLGYNAQNWNKCSLQKGCVLWFSFMLKHIPECCSFKGKVISETSGSASRCTCSVSVLTVSSTLPICALLPRTFYQIMHPHTQIQPGASWKTALPAQLFQGWSFCLIYVWR